MSGIPLSTCLLSANTRNSSIVHFTRTCLVLLYAIITIDTEALITTAEKTEKYYCHKWP